ncbi:MAG: arylsulfatase [Verrucomicrobiota bacterium]|nr:arylsulfatase [Verrucomicrobiota bacterium]
MTLRAFFLGSLFLALGLGAKTNVVVFLTDDQGWGDLSLNGNTNLSTPNIDSIGKEGAVFDRFYVCPVCSPTRAEFLTGRHHVRSGVYSTSAGGERMDLDETTIADIFSKAGYATGAFGKWHNGMQYPYHPLGRGFDYFYGFCSGHWGHYYDALMERNGELVKGKGFCVDDFTTEAMNFIDRAVKDEKPFFAYVPYNTPHSPMQVPDRWWNKFKDKKLEEMMRHRNPSREDRLHLLAALAMCENIDWNVGRVLKKLEQLKVVEDTIVLFFHDNGPNGTRWNGDMEGRKGSTEEGGTRSPLLIRWPNGIKPGTEVKQIASVLDLLPTLTEMAGVSDKPKKKLDGRSLVKLLNEPDSKDLKYLKSIVPRILISSWKSKVGARDQRFRLDYKGRLYDMENDPGQRIDVSKKFPKVFTRLTHEVNKYRNEVLVELGTDDRPFVIGHPDVSWTQIPARDAVPTGEIKRSNKFPNCSYFLNWKNEEDYISWDVEVGTTGIYEVELWYACPQKDLGAEIELSFQNQSLRTKITREVNPPLLTGFDRKTRTEGYVKFFEPMKMGKIRLKQGKGELKLQAIRIPGEQALEFRLLMINRVEEGS